jgi:hypothetical protein
MISAQRLNQTRSRAEGRTFLKYSDIPFGTRAAKVRCIDIRETPKLNSPCVLDIDKFIHCDEKQVETDKTSIPLNLTNMNALAKLVGDDLSAARGMILTFGFSLKNNPNARPGAEDSEVMGFDLIAADLPQVQESNEAPKPRRSR